MWFRSKKERKATSKDALFKSKSLNSKIKLIFDRIKSKRNRNKTDAESIADNKLSNTIEVDTQPTLISITQKIQKEEANNRQKHTFLLIGSFSVCVIILSLIFGVRSIKFNCKSESIHIGEPIDLKYSVVPSFARIDELYFEFSNPDMIQKDDDNQYIAVKEGLSKVNLYYKNKLYDTKNIEIKPILVESIKADDTKIGIGRTSNIDVSIYPKNATHTDYEVFSSNENVITFKDGLLFATGKGTAEITIKSIDGPTDTFRVESFVVEPTNIDIGFDDSNFIVGETVKSSIIYTPTDVTNKIVTYYSSDDAIAKFDDNGNLSILDAGTVVLKAAYSETIFAEKVITTKYPNVKTIAITDKTTNVRVGDTHKVEIEINPIKYNGELTWYSDDERVATVDSNGYVKAISTGSVRISVKSENGVKTSIKYKVSAPVVSVSSLNKQSSNNSSLTSKNISSDTKTYCLNTNTHKFHLSNCRDIAKMNESNKSWIDGTRDYIIGMGYSPCGHCHP